MKNAESTLEKMVNELVMAEVGLVLVMEWGGLIISKKKFNDEKNSVYSLST